jgi:hypothetical protein
MNYTDISMDYTSKDFVRALWHYMDPSDFVRLSYFAFLIQYDIINLRILKLVKKYMCCGRPITRLKFYIGYKHIIEIEDMPDPDTNEYNIPKNVKNKILDILAKYNKLKTRQLTHLIRKKLQLEPEEKRKDYIGTDVDHYLHIEKFKIIKKEI